MEELTRTQILERNLPFPSDLVKLIPTKHFLARLEERGLGLDIIPTMVRVTKDNIHSGKTEDGKTLRSVVVRLKYNATKYIFLAFNPNDGGLKTLWFRERRTNGSRRRRKGTARESFKQAV
jgi:hypothetical protein